MIAKAKEARQPLCLSVNSISIMASAESKNVTNREALDTYLAQCSSDNIVSQADYETLNGVLDSLIESQSNTSTILTTLLNLQKTTKISSRIPVAVLRTLADLAYGSGNLDLEEGEERRSSVVDGRTGLEVEGGDPEEEFRRRVLIRASQSTTKQNPLRRLD